MLSVFLGDKLYFLGGYVTTSGSHSNEVFYLDVSKPFKSNIPSWVDLTSSAAIPFGSSFATVSLININNSRTIYLLGGFLIDSESFIYAFNPQTLKWNIPQSKGNTQTRRRDIKFVSDDSGKVYIFGGYNDINSSFNDMTIFDTNVLTWSIKLQLMFLQQGSYTATLLSNNIGGLDNRH